MVPAEQEDLQKSHVDILQANSFQNGLLARSSKAIMLSSEISEIKTIFASTLEELSLSGCYRLVINQSRYLEIFGEGIQPGVLQKISREFSLSSKISHFSQYCVLQTTNLNLIIDFKERTALEIGTLQDTLSSLADIIQAWVDLHYTQICVHAERQREKLKSADRLHDILNCLARYNEHLIKESSLVYQNLLSSMITQFPKLSLEGDQEDAILDILESAHKKQEQIIQSQVKYNADLRSVLRDEIENISKELCTDPFDSIKKPNASLSSVELF